MILFNVTQQTSEAANSVIYQISIITYVDIFFFRHELSGTITDSQGNVLQNLFGKWSEGLYVGRVPSAKCIWRPGSLPEEADLYYGFSRHAGIDQLKCRTTII